MGLARVWEVQWAGIEMAPPAPPTLSFIECGPSADLSSWRSPSTLCLVNEAVPAPVELTFQWGGGGGGETDYKQVNRQTQMAMGAMENKARSGAVGRNNGGGGGLYRVVSLSDLGITGSWGFRKRLWGTEPGGCSCHPGQ